MKRNMGAAIGKFSGTERVAKPLFSFPDCSYKHMTGNRRQNVLLRKNLAVLTAFINGERVFLFLVLIDFKNCIHIIC